jgi:hypothetical protein
VKTSFYLLEGSASASLGRCKPATACCPIIHFIHLSAHLPAWDLHKASGIGSFLSRARLTKCSIVWAGLDFTIPSHASENITLRAYHDNSTLTAKTAAGRTGQNLAIIFGATISDSPSDRNAVTPMKQCALNIAEPQRHCTSPDAVYRCQAVEHSSRNRICV